MTHEDALIELAAAVTRLSDCVESTASVLQALCGHLEAERASPAAQSRTFTLQLIEGGRPAA
jgi:hypothetical protein